MGRGCARAPLLQRRKLRASSCSHPSSPSSTVADGSQALGMNEGAGCGFQQFPLSRPFSLGSAFVFCPIQTPSHRRPDWSRRLGSWCSLRLRTQLGWRNLDSRLGPTSDHALDFYRVPPLGREIRLGSREVGG